MPDQKVESQVPPAGALRVTFSYAGDLVRLGSWQEVDMTPLPSDTDVPEAGRPPVAQFGLRYQLVDAEGRVLYEQVARHLIPESLEAPTGDPEGPLSRHTVALTEGSFDIVVPVLDRARELVLSRGPTENRVRESRVEPVFSEVLRVNLTELGSSERG